MERDFTLSIYLKLLDTLVSYGYSFQRFDEFLLNPCPKVVILRHDVDKKPENSLIFANHQLKRGIKGVYYFRAKPCSWNERIIHEIASMGHEIGYHYENMATMKGDIALAVSDFETNLIELRKIVSVSTICMHGSPLSKYDNRDIWKSLDYKDFGIIGEPYFDIDFYNTLYLTDTGRSWNAGEASIRDRVKSNYSFYFKSTNDIIQSIEKNELPEKIMINIHPQRWNEKLVPWFVELATQQAKNPLKRFINSIQI
jgi:hypothetical protein